MDAVKLHLTVNDDVTTYLIDQHGLRPEGDAPLAARLLHAQSQTIQAEYEVDLYEAEQAATRVQKALKRTKATDPKLLADLALVIQRLQEARQKGPTKEIDITVELDT